MIPRIIHQTWRDRDIPPSLQAYVASWPRLHPGWEIRLWTDDDLAALVRQEYPHLAEQYFGYPRAIQRADLGRYLVLRSHGGVYADLDAEALRSFDDPVVRRYSASPATSMVGFPIAAVDQLWLRCTLGIAAAMGAATLFVFLGAYMLADRHDELAWILYGLAVVLTVAMVAIPWYCLRGLHAVLEASAEDARTA